MIKKDIDVESLIFTEEYYFNSYKKSVDHECIITLKNDFVVSSKVRCKKDSNYSAENGRELARDCAIEKLKEFERYYNIRVKEVKND